MLLKVLCQLLFLRASKSAIPRLTILLLNNYFLFQRPSALRISIKNPSNHLFLTSSCDKFYELPSTKHKRFTTQGYSQKIDFFKDTKKVYHNSLIKRLLLLTVMRFNPFFKRIWRKERDFNLDWAAKYRFCLNKKSFWSRIVLLGTFQPIQALEPTSELLV